MSRSLRNDILRIIDRFIHLVVDLDDVSEDWRKCMAAFFASIEQMVGRQAMVAASRTTDSATVPTSFLDELESLRARVEELAEEVSRSSEQNTRERCKRVNDTCQLLAIISAVAGGGKGSRKQDFALLASCSHLA